VAGRAVRAGERPAKPAPPMLMFNRITHIDLDGGANK
jgi:hypothetical protein